MSPFHCRAGRLQHEAKRRRGQALIETALALPLLVLLLVNAVNFGFYIYGYITVNNAARAVAQYRIYNGVAVGFPAAPTSTDLNHLLYDEVSALPQKGTDGGTNYTWGNINLRICRNKNGAVSCIGSGSYTPPADVEPARFALYSVEVTYQFTPLIPPFVVPGIKVPASVLPATINRHVLMRAMQ